MKIKSIQANEILSSIGYPTIEAAVVLESGVVGKASVPYGASAGSHEAKIVLDGEKRYEGKGQNKAIQHIQEIIAPELYTLEDISQEKVDKRMIDLDGTNDKSKLGGNAVLAVSLASARAMSAEMGLEVFQFIQQQFGLENKVENGQENGNKGGKIKLPNPMMVVIEGGKHADNSTDLQEFCLTANNNNDSAKEQIRKCIETYYMLSKLLKEDHLSTNVGNEGAFAPSEITSNEKPLEYIVRAIEAAGYKPKDEIGISMDAAASEFFHNGKYSLKLEGKEMTSDELIEYYKQWLGKYPIISLEDMFDEDDWDAWTKFNEVLKPTGIYHIGDDLTVTNKERVQMAIDKKAINAVLIKLNQIGTLTETVETCKLCAANNMITVPSHRGGGETIDTFMVDLAVAMGSEFMKVGPTRGERVAKYNRLMEIERMSSI